MQTDDTESEREEEEDVVPLRLEGLSSFGHRIFRRMCGCLPFVVQKRPSISPSPHAVAARSPLFLL